MTVDIEGVERAVVYTPQPGDVVVLETPDPMTREAVERLKTEAKKVFGPGVQITVLLGVRFAGVVREENR